VVATGNPPVTLRNTFPSDTRSTINPTLIGVELNTGLHDNGSASNGLRDGTIQQGQEYYRNKLSTGLFWFRARFRGGLYWTCTWTFGFHIKRTISSNCHRNDSFQMSTDETGKDGTQEALDWSKRQIKQVDYALYRHTSPSFLYCISNCHAPAAKQISMTRRCTGIIVCSRGFHLHD
jgi:hypothetical protein